MKKKLTTAIVATSVALSTLAPNAFAAVQSDAKYDALFVAPYKNVENNQKMFDTIGTDVITFSYTIRKVNDTSSYPKQVIDAVPKGNEIFSISDPFQWKKIPKYAKNVEVDGVVYTLVTNENQTVISKYKKSNEPRFENMIKVAKEKGADVYLGLPKVEGPKGAEWSVNKDYTPAGQIMTRMIIDNFYGEVDGFYLSVEMPVRDSSAWNSVYDFYQMQYKEIVNKDKDLTVLLSPYLTAKKSGASADKYCNDLGEYTRGIEKLYNINSGANLLIAPQDGLGVGSTALKSDNSDLHCQTTGDIFQAMEKGIGKRLLTNIEHMTPGEGIDGRGSSSIQRVNAQNKEESPFVNGKIAYHWNLDASPDSSMKEMEGIEKYLQNGYGGIKDIAYSVSDDIDLADAYAVSYDTDETPTISHEDSHKFSITVTEQEKKGIPANTQVERKFHSPVKFKVSGNDKLAKISKFDKSGNLTISPTADSPSGEQKGKIEVIYEDGSKDIVPFAVKIDGIETSENPDENNNESTVEKIDTLPKPDEIEETPILPEETAITPGETEFSQDKKDDLEDSTEESQIQDDDETPVTEVQSKEKEGNKIGQEEMTDDSSKEGEVYSSDSENPEPTQTKSNKLQGETIKKPEVKNVDNTQVPKEGSTEATTIHSKAMEDVTGATTPVLGNSPSQNPVGSGNAINEPYSSETQQVTGTYTGYNSYVLPSYQVGPSVHTGGEVKKDSIFLRILQAIGLK